MPIITRILALSFTTGGLTALAGYAILSSSPDAGGIALFLGCVGAIIGAIAAAARESANSHNAKVRPKKAT